jgi:hypothetical protein
MGYQVSEIIIFLFPHSKFIFQPYQAFKVML